MSEDAGRARVRMLGSLHTWRSGRGLPTEVEVPVPEGGVSSGDLAHALGLPLERIEAVFCNHRVYPLGHRIQAGDAVAFVPRGTPGPHRFTLGIYSAGNRADPQGV